MLDTKKTSTESTCCNLPIDKHVQYRVGGKHVALASGESVKSCSFLN